MCATRSLSDNPNPPRQEVTIPRARVLRWAERVEAAIENPPESMDVLLDLAEDLDELLDAPDQIAAWP